MEQSLALDHPQTDSNSCQDFLRSLCQVEQDHLEWGETLSK